MVQRPPKTQRRPRQVGFVDWKDEHRELFSMAGADWRAPAQIKITRSATRSTWEAAFRKADGQIVRLSTRLVHYPSGRFAILSEGLAIHFSVKSADLPSSGRMMAP